MHEVDETLSRGAVLRGRYLVLDVLGKGGFSAVYLVQDQQREESFFALKEVNVKDKEARERFAFECRLLERLVHPALPRVHSVFDNEEHTRLYMLMDYVEGPNLETLRLIQHEKRFSFQAITAMLAPIVDAIAYLHQQDPPIVHRDIKPANMIVPLAETKTVLVDFGIAKEHDAQGTTNAVRYGSHGYGAPEQYTAGTSTRTDIYGLGATLYTLLTGEIPADALERMTQLSNDKPDPLKPASALVPSIPLPMSRAIGRAMSIKMMERFATAREFWQAVQGEPGQQPHISEALPSRVVSPSTSVIQEKKGESATPLPQAKQAPARRSRKTLFLPFLLALVLIGGIGASYWGFTVFEKKQAATSTAGYATATSQALTPTETATATVMPNLPHLATSYTGTITDLLENVDAPMTLTHVQQNNGQITGSYRVLKTHATFIGLLDASRHISIIVPALNGRGQLAFTGTVQSDGKLSGSFCEIDQGSSCSSNGVFGVWRVAPATTR